MLGVDFGTTNTCAAYADAFQMVRPVSVRPVNTVPYDAIVSSTVLHPLSDNPILGVEAQDRLAAGRIGPDDLYLNAFKLYFDRNDLRERRLTRTDGGLAFDPLQEAEVSRDRWEWREVGCEYSRDEVVRAASALLAAVGRSADEQGATTERILLGIPVVFSSRARKRLLAALYETGLFGSYKELLSRVQFILEPVAAAAAGMREALDVKDVERVLVFDHGGGTLDLSLIEFRVEPDFDFPVPRRELAAGGSALCGGGVMDQALRDELELDPAVREMFAREPRPLLVPRYIERAKQDLSTRDHTEIITATGTIPVDRELFDRAMAPLLGHIEQEVTRVVARAGLELTEVDRVLMTGGSSLVPCVQDELAYLFEHLDGTRLRRYDPRSTDDIERAITEVAQGLVFFGQSDVLERIVLWDVELATAETAGFTPIARQGEPYPRVEGRSELRTKIRLADENLDGGCIGIYEQQLGRRYVFGLADVPHHAEPATVEVRLRPDSLYPAVRVLDASGQPLQRRKSPTGWRSDLYTVADLEELDENQLEEFFEEEHDYLPGTRYEGFEHAPLTRLLRVGDRIEWTSLRPAAGASPFLRGSGEIVAIRKVGSHDYVDAMELWNLELYDLLVRDDRIGGLRHVTQPQGYVRLAPRGRPGR